MTALVGAFNSVIVKTDGSFAALNLTDRGFATTTIWNMYDALDECIPSTNYEPNINSFDVDGLLLKLDKFVPDSRQWPGPVDNTIKLFIHKERRFRLRSRQIFEI